MCLTASLRSLMVALLLAALLAGCATRPSAPSAGGVQHVVLFWLKEPGNPEHRRRILEATRGLASIPGLVSVSAGLVIPSERAIVDDSFDVGVVMRFESEAAMHAYLEHPEHRKAVAEVIRPLVRKIRVHDIRLND